MLGIREVGYGFAGGSITRNNRKQLLPRSYGDDHDKGDDDDDDGNGVDDSDGQRIWG